MNRLSFLMFFIIILLIFFGLNYYVYRHIAKGFQVTGKIRLYLKLFFIAGGLCFIGSEILRRVSEISVLSYIGAVWIGIVVISFSVFIVKDIISLFPGLNNRTLTLYSLVLIFVLSLYSLWNAARTPHIKEIKLKLAQRPSSLKGFTIVHLTDLHLGTLTPHKKLGNIVNKVNSLKPDLIVITGDLIDQDICHQEQYCSTLSSLHARYGVYTVTGNHEFYAGVEKFEDMIKKAGFISLRNRKVTIAGSIIGNSSAVMFCSIGCTGKA